MSKSKSKSKSTDTPPTKKSLYYQVMKNTDIVSNPDDVETGIFPFEYIGLAKCTGDSFAGPVDTTDIPGLELEQEYETATEFLADCKKAHYLAKQSEF